MAASKQRLLQNADKYLQRGSYERAIRTLKKAIQVDPRDIQVRKKLGEAYYRHGMRDDAAAEFLALADYFRSGGLLPKAVAMYKRALQIQPKRSKFRFQLAELYNELGMRADAVAHLRKLAEITQAEGKGLKHDWAFLEKLAATAQRPILHNAVLPARVDAEVHRRPLRWIQRCQDEGRPPW